MSDNESAGSLPQEEEEHPRNMTPHAPFSNWWSRCEARKQKENASASASHAIVALCSKFNYSLGYCYCELHHRSAKGPHLGTIRADIDNRVMEDVTFRVPDSPEWVDVCQFQKYLFFNTEPQKIMRDDDGSYTIPKGYCIINSGS